MFTSEGTIMTIDTGEKEENAGQLLRKGVPNDHTGK